MGPEVGPLVGLGLGAAVMVGWKLVLGAEDVVGEGVGHAPNSVVSL